MSGGTDEEGGGQDDGRAALEAEAREFGWAPRDQWRGNPDAWRDAEDFVEHGRKILPIVNKKNERLLRDLQDARNQIAQLKTTMDGQSKTMQDLIEHQASEIKRQVEGKLRDLREQKITAIEEGDHRLAARLETEIDSTRDALAEANKPAPAPSPAPNTRTFQGKEVPADVEPWALEFAEANDSWLGKDKRKTALFAGICEDLNTNKGLAGRPLLEAAKKEMEETLAPKAPRTAKSESGGGGWTEGGGGGRSGGKSFADLPTDAKEVCRKQAARYVGPEGSGKAFKTDAAWQEHYAKTFFATTEK